MTQRYRQEVFNILLAQLLNERGIVSAPESILKTPTGQGRRMPDVLVDFHGLRTAIEGEVGDRPDAGERALASARNRVEEGIAHIGVAVVYPARLREVEFPDLKGQLAVSGLETAIVTESGTPEFFRGDVAHLGDALRRAFTQLVQEDVVAQAVAALDAGVERLALTVVTKKGVISRIVKVLNMGGELVDGKPTEETLAVSRIAGLIITNGLIFHEMLAGFDNRVTTLEPFLQRRAPLVQLARPWQDIIDQINYFPIFHLALELLVNMTANAAISDALENLARIAQDIVRNRAALRHDLMGRIYHRLLSSAKYLGTYYTSIPAATLLLKLALRTGAWPVDWADLDQVAQLRMADLACGTGTLLMAAAEALTDNYIRRCAEHDREIDLTALHATLIENALYGYDVIPSALHLTASTLALHAPETPFTRMHMYSLPLGGEHNRLGSIEFLENGEIQMVTDMFGAATSGAQQLTGTEAKDLPVASLPPLDLCAINPPFTRSVGGNLLFGSAPEDERERMQKKLQKLVQRKKALANITAGLGSVFVAAADMHLKPEGRLALVLPKALISGVAWEPTRQLLASRYHVEFVIVSQDPHRWNFSESTDLSEVLVLAAKLEDRGLKPPAQGEVAAPRRVTAVNLWRNPTTAFEALAVARALEGDGAPDIAAGQGALGIFLGNEKFGEAVALPWDEMKNWDLWMLPFAFAQSDLIRVAYHLRHGTLWLPGYGQVGEMSLCPLGELGELGPDRRDIHDGFALSNTPTAYPAFWGHEAEEALTMAQEPNRYLIPLPEAKKGRPLRRVEDLWPKSGRILMAERLWLVTQRLVAMRVSEKVLSNVWWPFVLNPNLQSDQNEKAMMLWLNSTFGLLQLLAHREETRGAWIGFKKPVLAALPVLDLRALSPGQLSALAAAYDRLCAVALNPLPRMQEDETRAEIDRAIAGALSLPDYSVLREMLAREPVVSLKRL